MFIPVLDSKLFVSDYKVELDHGEEIRIVLVSVGVLFQRWSESHHHILELGHPSLLVEDGEPGGVLLTGDGLQGLVGDVAGVRGVVVDVPPETETILRVTSGEAAAHEVPQFLLSILMCRFEQTAA